MREDVCMKIITNLENVKLNNAIITIGKFDGNHIGHQLLFDTVRALKQEGDCTVVFTFNIPPVVVTESGSADTIRTIQTHNERFFGEAFTGIDYIVEFPFNKHTMTMEPEVFVKEILVEKLGVKSIVVGEDFCFGKDRKGNVDVLKQLGNQFGFTVHALKKVAFQPEDFEKPVEVSSTLIKEEILRGNMEDVRKMLGRPFSMTGEILHGKHVGSTIGFPTINFAAPADKILPPNGVYATRSMIEGQTFNSITNVGKRPTFDDGEFRTVETNIFDFNKDVYGKIARVDFYRFIRPERRFSSPEELMEEIDRNVQEVRAYFKDLRE